MLVCLSRFSICKYQAPFPINKAIWRLFEIDFPGHQRWQEPFRILRYAVKICFMVQCTGRTPPGCPEPRLLHSNDRTKGRWGDCRGVNECWVRLTRMQGQHSFLKVPCVFPPSLPPSLPLSFPPTQLLIFVVLERVKGLKFQFKILALPFPIC